MKKAILEFFRTPSHIELAQRELADAQRELLLAQTAAEYANAMITYNCDRIIRLKAALNQP
jgi:hypothetical protein